MVEEKQIPLQIMGKITAWPSGTTPQTMNNHTVLPLGEYHPVDWADSDLKIVKFEWRTIDPGPDRTIGRGSR
jgi:hypothetical protein